MGARGRIRPRRRAQHAARRRRRHRLERARGRDRGRARPCARRAPLAAGGPAARRLQHEPLRRRRGCARVGRADGGDRRRAGHGTRRRAWAALRARAESLRPVARRRFRDRRQRDRQPEQHAARRRDDARARARVAGGRSDARRRDLGRARRRPPDARPPPPWCRRDHARVHGARARRLPALPPQCGVLAGGRMKMNGADAILRSLEAEGVEVIFGLPGGAILPLYDAMARGTTVRHVLARHEQGAGHMAEGYARASGRVGVAVATSGPGATNLVTPIADAWMDSTPIVCITGQVRSNLIGTDAFQETDATGITMPIVKHSWLDQDVREAAKAIAAARQPIVYAGGGVINAEASAELLALVETGGLPAVVTLMGKGCLPDSHPLDYGAPGMHGSKYANWALNKCDLIIAIGVRFDDRVTGKVSAFAPGAKVIHFDIDAAEVGKIREAEIPVVGPLKLALAQ